MILQPAFKAFLNPQRADQIAILSEATSYLFLENILFKMQTDKIGRQILLNKPLLNSKTLEKYNLKSLPENTFGKNYFNFMSKYNITIDSRSPITLIKDQELAYVMLRYRQVHDFWHVLLGFNTSVESEIAVKWFEFMHMGLPVALLSSIVGPLRLSTIQRRVLFDEMVPWSVQNAGSCKYLMNVYYEELLDRDLNLVKKELGFLAK